MKSKWALVGLGLVLFAQLLFAAHRMYTTTDEHHFHIPAGLVYWETGDWMAINPSTPPLPRLIATLPAFLSGVNVPLDHPSRLRYDAQGFAKALFYESGNDPKQLVFLSRLPIVFASLLLWGLIVYWSFLLWGIAGSLLSAFLAAFSPTLIAHGSLATLDAVTALTFALACFGLWQCLEGKKSILWPALFLALALWSKHTVIILIPISFVLFAWKGRWQSWFGYVGLAAFFLWAGYGFEVKPMLEGAPRIPEKVQWLKGVTASLSAEWQAMIMNAAYEWPIPLRTHIYTLLGVIKHSKTGHMAYLLGNTSQTGWWYYFIVACLLKTPLTILIALMCAGVHTLKSFKTADIYLMFPVIVLFVVASQGNVHVGVRHILPLYPLLFIWVGKVALLPEKYKQTKYKKGLASLLGLWLIISVVLSAPNYLGYFNELIGGPKNGHKYLGDSNVDWRIRP